MKLFSWMHNKLNANKQPVVAKKLTAAVSSSSSHHARQESREEFSDWPHSLLAIGTFGNTTDQLRSENPEIQTQNLQEHQEQEDDEIEIPSSASSPDDLQDFTAEEIGKLQKELTKLLSKKPKEKEAAAFKNLPLDRFLNCPSSLEVDRRISSTAKSDIDENNNNNNNEEDIERTISVILGRCKDICEKKKKKAIGKKSISFLLKKMLVCSSGFAPQPSLRDTFQESRMEKLLRMMLQRKINPQNTSRASSTKKYLEHSNSVSYRKDNQENEKEKEKICDGSKWVKTDSEYIVLEI